MSEFAFFILGVGIGTIVCLSKTHGIPRYEYPEIKLPPHRPLFSHKFTTTTACPRCESARRQAGTEAKP